MLVRLALSCVLASSLLVPSGTVPAAAEPPEPAFTAKQLPGPERARDAGGGEAFDRHAVLVRFRGNAPAAARDKALRTRGVKRTGAAGGGSYVKVEGTAAAPDLLRSLRNDPAVESASLDFRRRVAAVPNDPGYTQNHQPYLGTVRLPQAWDLAKDATKQVIAVLDTGVNTSHPDLAGRTVPGYNAVTGGTAVTDEDGHGTMVAGVAAANTNNGVGVAGAAWNGRIMPVKVFRSDGSAYDSDIIRGITWAADHGARVVNLSLGGPDESAPLHDAIKYATNKGVLVVAAAGNSSDNTPQYPAAYGEVLSVGATDKSGTLTDFSSWGSWLDLAAPGFDITSTYLGSSYAVAAGTSFSAPLVAGVAALVRTRFPSYTPIQVMARLKVYARDAGPRGVDPYYGHGLLDAFAAVGGARTTDLPQLALGAGEPNDVPARAIELTTSLTGTMAAEGDVDWYRYDADVATDINIRVTPAPEDLNRAQNFDPVLAVYDTELRLLGEIDRGAWGDEESLALTVKGSSYIAVRNFNGAPDVRPYTVSVATAPASLFAPAQSTPVGSRPEAVAVGDVTGDGRTDVLLTTSANLDAENDYKLFVFGQQPDGSLAAPVRYATQLESGAAMGAGLALLDADGNGRTDVALATPAGIEIFHQTDAGLLESIGTLPGTTGAKGVVAADMDADGDTDLVMTGSNGTSLVTHMPDHTFEPSTVSTAQNREVEVGDIDGDGRTDVVGYEGGIVRAYHRTEDGWRRTDHLRVSSGGGDVKGIEIVDLNSDGRSDVAAMIDASSTANVFYQTADGTLDAPVVHPVSGNNPAAVDAGDLDGNGRPDLAVAHGRNGAISALFQNADGTLSRRAGWMAPYADFHNPQGLAVGDVNGDGRLDVVNANQRAGLVVLRNGAALTAAGEQQWIRNVAPADFAGGVATTAVPTVTFQGELDPATVCGSTVRLVNGRTGATVPGTVTYDAATRTVSVKPAALPDNTPYRIIVGAVRDVAGAVHPESSSTFATVDPAPPAISNFVASGAYGSAALSWTLPGVPDLSHVVLRMSMGAPPASPTSDTAVYTGAAGSTAVTGLGNGRTYWVRAWVRDRTGKLSSPVDVRLVGTRFSTSIAPSTVTYGGTVKLTGRLFRNDTGAAMPGVPVQLYARLRGTSSWRLLGTVTTNSTGTATYSHRPVAGQVYQWGYSGGQRGLLGSRGYDATVAVRPVVSAYVSRTSFPLGGSVQVYGSVVPAHPGQVVYLQRYVSGRWVSVATGKLSTKSTYTFTVKPGVRGTYAYRVRRPADVDHLEAFSPMRTFKVT